MGKRGSVVSCVDHIVEKHHRLAFSGDGNPLHKHFCSSLLKKTLDAQTILWEEQGIILGIRWVFSLRGNKKPLPIESGSKSIVSALIR